MLKFQSFVFCFVFVFQGLAQEKIAQLPPELKESSALLKYQNHFFTVNDSDNEPIVFIFNEKGEITHRCFVANVINMDWEALAYDGEKFLYIGDIGNNENNRKDLAIYKVEIDDVLRKDTVNVEIINFSYPDQKEFPPLKSELYYDAEGMIVKDNQLLIFTKNRTEPFDGISKIYTVPTESGTYSAKANGEIKLPATHWLEESVVDATYHENKLYLLTYSKVYTFVWSNNEWVQKKEYLFDSITQKEGIAVDGKYIYITDENNKSLFDGNFLYKMKR